MKYGFVMPPDEAQKIVSSAVEAERAGWDAFFLADGMWCIDAWLCLAAAAAQTESIRLGTLLSPLSIMRPWKLAAEAATLDQLSNGRVILSLGMGATDVGFAEFGRRLICGPELNWWMRVGYHDPTMAGGTFFTSR